VLSVATALSIQAHPDKALAERLFAERPDVYKARVCKSTGSAMPACVLRAAVR
jgi:mannose-6-phosphate isomerase class I